MQSKLLVPLRRGALSTLLVAAGVPTAHGQSSVEYTTFLTDAAQKVNSKFAEHAAAEKRVLRVALFPPLRRNSMGNMVSSILAEELVDRIVAGALNGVEYVYGEDLVNEMSEDYWSADAYVAAKDAHALAQALGFDGSVGGTLDSTQSGLTVERFATFTLRSTAGAWSISCKAVLPPGRGGERVWNERTVSQGMCEAKVPFGGDDRIERIVLDDARLQVLLHRQLVRFVASFDAAVEASLRSDPLPARLGIMPVWRQDTKSYSRFSEVLDMVLEEEFPTAMRAPEMQGLLTSGRRIDASGELVESARARTLKWYAGGPLEANVARSLGLGALILGSYRHVEGSGVRLDLRLKRYDATGPELQRSEFFPDVRIQGYVARVMGEAAGEFYHFEDVELDYLAELQDILQDAAFALARKTQGSLAGDARLYVVSVMTPATERERTVLEQLWGELDNQRAEMTKLAHEQGRPLDEILATQPISIGGTRYPSIRDAETGIMQTLETGLVFTDSARLESTLASELVRKLSIAKAFPRQQLQLSESTARGGGAGRRSVRQAGNFSADAPKTFQLKDSRYWLLPRISDRGDFGLTVVVELLDTHSYELVEDGIVERDVSIGVARVIRKRWEAINSNTPVEFLRPFREKSNAINAVPLEAPGKSKDSGP